MATSAFKSTTKRTPISADSSGSSSSSSCGSVIRRSKSLTGFSRRLTMASDDAFADDASGAPREAFVNNVRGSDFSEISLDDLAIEFFCSSGVSPVNAVGNGRWGRSVSRKGSSGGSGSYKSGGGSSNSEFARRRRSVSMGRCQISDSESDVDNSRNLASYATKVKTSRGSSQSRKPNSINSGQALRRSTSQKDLKPYDDCSSLCSALTDDEEKDGNSSKNAEERIIRSLYAQKIAEYPIGEDKKAGLHQAMCKELRHAVEEDRVDLEKVILKSNPSLAHGYKLHLDNGDVLQDISSIGRNCTTKLPQQHGKKISEIVKDLLVESRSTGEEKPRSRKRCNDRCGKSKRLSVEAEKYIQDFVSNVEDVEISSLDGERSDTRSSIGGLS